MTREGSGSLLLTVGKHLDDQAQKDLEYYGQEKNTATYNLSRMNLLLHGVRPEKMEIRNGDTLAEDWPEDPKRPNEGVQFDAVVMNPPYSLKNWNREDLKVSDPRFATVGVLPPKSKGDYAFLLHGLFHLNTSGTMAIVLPHGVLFRGGAEGEIRKRLLEKNYIDTIIGMPANLFTNTSIPVVVIILKKNRALDEPVLIIDASENFEKAGKQNRLREKDIAKITDVYVARSEIPGYSHLTTREEIIENEYNLNIPRYVDNIDREIPHDVDAHLYGGIPLANIEDLKILQAVVPEVLSSSLDTVREGYVELNKTVDQLKQDILESDSVVAKTNELERKLKEYIEDYWNLLRQVDDPYSLNQISDSMLSEIKDLLDTFDYIDIYDGYQIIAELWNSMLQHDLELIAVDDFYNVARSREPNMVTKGSGRNKREEQEGWNGAIVPNTLIAENLYVDELSEIEDKEIRLSEVESDLEELFEAIVDEDSEENEYLYGILRMNKDDEPTGNYDKAAIKRELKNATEDSPEYPYLRKAKKLNDTESRLKRQIKKQKKELDEAVQDRILELTNEEIDSLVYEKWFSKAFIKLLTLIKEPILDDIDILKLLDERYSETIDDIDAQIAELEKELEAMMSEMVVTTDE